MQTALFFYVPYIHLFLFLVCFFHAIFMTIAKFGLPFVVSAGFSCCFLLLCHGYGWFYAAAGWLFVSLCCCFWACYAVLSRCAIAVVRCLLFAWLMLLPFLLLACYCCLFAAGFLLRLGCCCADGPWSVVGPFCCCSLAVSARFLPAAVGLVLFACSCIRGASCCCGSLQIGAADAAVVLPAAGSMQFVLCSGAAQPLVFYSCLL